jgi:thioredoxin reductase (NADPH)
MLYRTRTVCVVGNNAEAVEEANFLAGIGAEVVFLAKKRPHGLDEGIAAISGTVIEIQGDEKGVTGLVIRTKQASKTETITCAGVFILRPSIAPDALIAGLELADGHIVVDRTMSTNREGIFAAGDCTGRPLQVAKATGEGQSACFSAVRYLDQSLGAD